MPTLKKLTDLPAVSALASDMLVAVVDDPGGTPVTKKATIQDFIDAIPGGALIPLYDEGILVTAGITSLNFVGARVTATADGSGNATVTVAFSLAVYDEAVLKTSSASSLNFVGNLVTATESSGAVTVTVSGPTIKDDGSNVDTNCKSINFTGTGVASVTTDGSGAVTVEITGGGGGGGGSIDADTVYEMQGLRIDVGTTPTGGDALVVLGGAGTLGTQTADTVQFAAVDYAAGDRRLKLRSEAGNDLWLGSATVEAASGELALRAASGSAVVVTQATASAVAFKIATTETNDDPLYEVLQSRVATTDGTQTSLFSFAPSSSKTYLIEARVLARRTGGVSGTADDGLVAVVRAMVTTVSSTVTLWGVTKMIEIKNQSAWSVDMDVNSGNVRVLVTGAASNNVTWHATIIRQSVGS